MQFTAWSFFLLTIVRRPDTSDDMRSLPALAVTIVLCAPETAVRDKKGHLCDNKTSSIDTSRFP